MKEKRRVYPCLPQIYLVQPNLVLGELLAKLSPDVPWGDRKVAANRIGNLRQKDALPGLILALHADPFWMVRCSIIQAIEKIGDPGVLPELEKVKTNDTYQAVRSYAAKAIERLSRC